MSHRLPTALAAAACAAMLASGCSGEGGGSATPTGPTTPTTGTTGPQSPTNSSCIPAAPGNLQVATTGSTRVFTWSAVNGVQDYFIQIGSASGGKDLVDTNTTQTTYSWTGASAGTYYARVYGRNSCGSGPNSTELIVH